MNTCSGKTEWKKNDDIKEQKFSVLFVRAFERDMKVSTQN